MNRDQLSDWLHCLNGGMYDWVADEIKKELAKPEQKLNDPPSYVEPPTSDYHNGWEEGFEAAKNLFKKESAPQNADPRLLLGRKDNCTALAQPRKPWQGLTSEDWENTPDTGKQGCERDAELFDWIEQTLKDKNA